MTTLHGEEQKRRKKKEEKKRKKMALNIFSLPNEMLVEIARHLPKEDKVALRGTCQRFKTIMDTPQLWKKRLIYLNNIHELNADMWSTLRRIAVTRVSISPTPQPSTTTTSTMSECLKHLDYKLDLLDLDTYYSHSMPDLNENETPSCAQCSTMNNQEEVADVVGTRCQARILLQEMKRLRSLCCDCSDLAGIDMRPFEDAPWEEGLMALRRLHVRVHESHYTEHMTVEGLSLLQDKRLQHISLHLHMSIPEHLPTDDKNCVRFMLAMSEDLKNLKSFTLIFKSWRSLGKIMYIFSRALRLPRGFDTLIKITTNFH